VVPFQAGWIALRGEGQDHIPVATQGYAAPLTAYFQTPQATEELELLGMNRSRPPACLRDLPVPPAELHSWADYLWPAGFREGVAAGLFTPDGRHLGFLCLLTDTDRHPTDAARDLIGKLTQMIATAVDPMRSIVAAARIARSAEAGIVLTRAGNALPLPGLPTHPLLTPASDVLITVAERLTGGQIHATFLCPDPGNHAPAGYARITMLACPTQPPDYLTAVVVVSPPGDLCGLTRRQLEILGLLIEDWSDQRIATALNLPLPTVAENVERILTKLGAPTRIGATLRALRRGLYVPRSFNSDGI
jgi:DNA-binding CsgD family transcriptional regulator